MPPRLDCCEDCSIAEDSFDRENSSPPSGNWHVLSGEWEIEDGELVGDGLLATTVCHPSGYTAGAYVARMILVGMSDGSVSAWEVAVGKPDDPSYVVEVLHNFGTGTATLKLWGGDKDSLLWEESYFGATENAPLTICYAPGLAISVDIGFIPSLQFCDSGEGDPCYTIGGVDAGGFAFRKGRFDDWTYDSHWIDNRECEKCPCFCEKSDTDFSCFPENLTLSFASVGAEVASLGAIGLKQSFLTYATDWPEKTTWLSEVQECFGPVGAKFTVKFECAQAGLGTLSFGTEDYNFSDSSNPQIVFSWVEGTNVGNLESRLAIKEDSTCDPLELVFPEVRVNSAFPSPTCMAPPCDTEGCYTPYCTDLNGNCYPGDTPPDIRFIPTITI